MTTEVQNVLNSALALSLPLREELAAHLAGSLIDTLTPTLEQQSQINAEWETEIERRLTEYDHGVSKPIPGEQVMRELREKFGT